MKKNQMDFMRKTRKEALEKKIRFITFHIADSEFINYPNIKEHVLIQNKGSITVAFKQMSEGLDPAICDPQARYFRVQCAFCSPKEKNPSKIFGEGLATLRLLSKKSYVMAVEEGQNFIKILKEHVLIWADHRSVYWMENVHLQDLV